MIEVCLDAGLIVKLVVDEPDSYLVDTLFSRWKQAGARLIAPAFAYAEVDSVLRQKITRGELTQEQADQSFRASLLLPIRGVAAKNIRVRAWTLAKEFQFGQMYDTVYLALAELHNCDFWTADGRLHNRVKDQLRYVHHIQEVEQNERLI